MSATGVEDLLLKISKDSESFPHLVRKYHWDPEFHAVIHAWASELELLANAARHPHKGPNDTDGSMLLEAAHRIEGGYPPGGSNTKDTVVAVLRAVAMRV